MGIPYLGNARIAVTFNNIQINTDNQLISGYFETTYDAAKGMTFLSDDETVPKDGITDEKTYPTVDFTINPNIIGKAVFVDDADSGIREGDDYDMQKGENGYYLVTLYDDDGNEHEVKVDSLPALVEDKERNIYEINENGTTINKIYTFENQENVRVEYNIDVEETTIRVNNLIEELILNIEEKLQNNDDVFFNLAYDNTNDLRQNASFDIRIGHGGQHANGKISIGRNGVVENDNSDGSDGDVMATIFHEYIHYLCFKFGYFPKKYEDIENGTVFSANIPLEDELEDDAIFMERVYGIFIVSKYNTPEEDKYMAYPTFYKHLNESQRLEIDDYIEKENLKPEVMPVTYQYIPSNLALDELNAHNKTLEASSLGLFPISQKKLHFYKNELERYNRQYENCLKIEEEYSYTPEGYKF